MAVKADIVESDHLFIGEDKEVNFLVKENGIPVDASSWDLLWSLARHKEDTAVITVESPDITVGDGEGTGDKVTVPLADTDTDALLSGWYVHGLWRTDDGAEAVLSYGKVYLGRAAR